MTASIFWMPLKDKKNRINTDSPSAFMVAMETVFGGYPVELEDDEETRAALRGMAAASKDSIYDDILEVLEQSKKIRIWSES